MIPTLSTHDFQTPGHKAGRKFIADVEAAVGAMQALLDSAQARALGQATGEEEEEEEIYKEGEEGEERVEGEDNGGGGGESGGVSGGGRGETDDATAMISSGTGAVPLAGMKRGCTFGLPSQARS